MSNDVTEGSIYLLVDAGESESGTCKDREIFRCEPEKLVEVCVLAGAAMGYTHCYIYIRGEYVAEAARIKVRQAMPVAT